MDNETFADAIVNPLPLEQLTPQQRVVVYVLSGLARDMQTRSVAEQHTAALLMFVADAVERSYEHEAVALLRAWRLEREAESGC